jgi:TDG/mug DNA glycosylase family protein
MVAGRVPRAELERHRGAYVDDLLGPVVRLLFVGINPGLWTAAVNAHFARPGNRFWPALYRAGITERQFDVSGGMSAEEAHELTAAGIGITNLVPAATARADELSSAELRAGVDRLRALVRRHRPPVVAILGKTAYRQGFGVRDVVAGRQPERLQEAELWVLPNPSGLNAHDTIDTLARAYRAAAEAAGLSVSARGSTRHNERHDR